MSTATASLSKISRFLPVLPILVSYYVCAVTDLSRSFFYFYWLLGTTGDTLHFYQPVSYFLLYTFHIIYSTNNNILCVNNIRKSYT